MSRLGRNHRKVFGLVASLMAVLFIISAIVCLFALRSNNLHMVKLRDQVYSADKSGHGVVPALQKLQTYVTNHMNTSLDSGTGIHPPIQLKYTYERQKKAGDSLGHTKFYTKAQNHCQTIYPIESSLTVWQDYVACVQSYLNSHNVNIKLASPVPTGLYKFDFASPTWSPDLAGWSLVLAIVFLIAAISFSLAALLTRKKSQQD